MFFFQMYIIDANLYFTFKTVIEGEIEIQSSKNKV